MPYNNQMEHEPRKVNKIEKIATGTEATLESIETKRQLENFLAEGYVLHGSKKQSVILEPRPAKDMDETRVIGNQDAIYATDADLEIPLFMAMKDFKDPANRSMNSGNSGQNGVFRMYGDNTKLTPGYVYVLPKDSFEVITDVEGNEELISRVPVMPHAVFRVEPDIFNLFPNVTFDFK